MNKNETSIEVQKIQAILNKNKSPQSFLELDHFTPEDKCAAIFNWYDKNDSSFNMHFVESVHDQYLRNGDISPKQVAALDSIITKYNIDMDRYLLW